MENLEKKIGIAIEQERKKMGLSQAGLGKICGMRQASISEIEDGKRKVSLHNLDQIAMALKIQLWVLVRRAEKLPIKDLT